MINEIQSTNTRDVLQAAVKGAKWVFLSALVSNVCHPIFTIILARLLVPSDFGLIAYTTIFMGVVRLIQDIGLNQALIQKKGEIGQSADVVFTINILLGFFWYLLTYFASPYITEFFGDYRLLNILRIMALNFLIIPFGIVQNTLLRKNLQFDKVFILKLVPAFAPGIASILLALLNYGVWALVLGSLIGSIFSVIVTWLSVPWRPKLSFNFSGGRQLLKFGGAVSAESLLSWAVNTADDALVGKWLGSSSLGLYTVGFNIGIAPAKHISSPLINVALPAFSMIQDDKDTIRDAFLKAIKLISLITFPLGSGIAVTASKFVPVFFGEKWISTVPIIQLISIYGIFMSIGSILPQVYKALGRPDIYLKYVFGRFAIALPVYFYTVPMGLTAISTAHLLLTAIFFPINVYIGMRIMAISIGQLMDTLWVSIVGALGVAAIGFLLQEFIIDGLQISSLASLLIIVCIASTCNIFFLYFAKKEILLEMGRLLLKMIVK